MHIYYNVFYDNSIGDQRNNSWEVLGISATTVGKYTDRYDSPLGIAMTTVGKH